MQICMGIIGVFLGCFGYNLLLKECCKGILNLMLVELFVVFFDDDVVEMVDLMLKKCCLICEIVMDSYVIDGGCKLYVCGNNLDCVGFEFEEGEFKIKGYDGLIILCDKCDGEMQLKMGCFGFYFVCLSCDNICKVLKSG